ncbi:hypothetical protein K438DRAFT_1756718 [Mycena galopus ATCC 62051]|nr:hypothetical protein K438DRAFT_1756718 [Mycena galopus ATCC 62051]
MSDTNYALSSSLSFWTPPFIPNNVFHFITLGVALVCLLVYTIHHNRPSIRLDRLDEAISVATGVLADAKTKCMRIIYSLQKAKPDSWSKFLLTVGSVHWLNILHQGQTLGIYTPFSVSGDSGNALENLPAWHSDRLAEHHDMRARSTGAPDIHLLIEATRQRQLAAEIRESQEIITEMQLHIWHNSIVGSQLQEERYEV